MPKAHPLFWLPIVALLLSSCSDPQAPTESNFRKAIEPTLTAPVCYTLGFSGSPLRRFYAGNVDEASLTLQRAGLIDIADNAAATVPNAHIETVRNTSLWTESKGFCLGTKKLEKIVDWTEPSKADNGELFSHVTYEWSLIPAPWATEDLFRAFHQPTHGTHQINLFRSKQGWSR